ncbi:hypothetical protein E0G79_26440, partial [Salmonella enterica]|nr:hypothetical protein [Salmonella enterica]
MFVFGHPHREHLVAFVCQSSLLITPGWAGNISRSARCWTSRRRVSGFRGAALNQSRSASGVYTGLEWWHERDYQERPLAGKFAASVRKVAYASPVDMPPPRSLGRWRSGRETAAGGSCSFRTDHGTDTAGA